MNESEFNSKLAAIDERIKGLYARLAIAKGKLTARLVTYIGDQILTSINSRIQSHPEVTLKHGKESVGELKKEIATLKANECALFESKLSDETFWPSLQSDGSASRVEHGYFGYSGSGYQRIESQVAISLGAVGVLLSKWNYLNQNEYYREFGGLPSKNRNKWSDSCKLELEAVSQIANELSHEQNLLATLQKGLNELKAKILWESVETE